MTQNQALRNKEAVRARDGYKCTRCGMTNDAHKKKYTYKRYNDRLSRSLHVHRINPSLGYIPSNCTTLCYSCHGRHARKVTNDRLRVIIGVMEADMATIDEAAGKSGITASEFITHHSLTAAKRILEDSGK